MRRRGLDTVAEGAREQTQGLELAEAPFQRHASTATPLFCEEYDVRPGLRKRDEAYSGPSLRKQCYERAVRKSQVDLIFSKKMNEFWLTILAVRRAPPFDRPPPPRAFLCGINCLSNHSLWVTAPTSIVCQIKPYVQIDSRPVVPHSHLPYMQHLS